MAGDAALLEAVAAVRPGVRLTVRPSPPDELVVSGGGEVFRLPRTPEASARLAVLVKALPALRPLVPVVVPAPRWVGVLADGATPFTGEPRLPGVRPSRLEGIALGQLEGVVAALLAVGPRQARQWGVPGEGLLLHGALTRDALLADPRTGLLTGVVGWRLQLGDPAAAVQGDLRGLLEPAELLGAAAGVGRRTPGLPGPAA